jgi:hypothetical protein
LSRVARTFAIGASALAAALGLTFGLFLPSIAHAQEVPPTTAPTPTLPTPDPAPAPKPKPTPKPTPKPAPKSTPRTTPRTYSTPTYQAPRPQSVAPRTTTKPKVRAPKPKKKVEKAPVTTETTVLPKVNVTPPIGAVGVRNAFQTKSGGSSDLGAIVIVLGLALAIACFAMALVPATHVRWRPVAIFVSERQVDLTIIGLALLMGAVFTFLWTKG